MRTDPRPPAVLWTLRLLLFVVFFAIEWSVLGRAPGWRDAAVFIACAWGAVEVIRGVSLIRDDQATKRELLMALGGCSLLVGGLVAAARVPDGWKNAALAAIAVVAAAALNLVKSDPEQP